MSEAKDILQEAKDQLCEMHEFRLYGKYIQERLASDFSFELNALIADLRARLKTAEEKNEVWTSDWDHLVEDHAKKCEHVDQMQKEIDALAALIRDTDMGQIACCDCKAQHVCEDSENCADVRIKWALANARKAKS